jgi:ABC-type bacteriocin/lantibiotic exporter with double-glycine peptidase domain
LAAVAVTLAVLNWRYRDVWAASSLAVGESESLKIEKPVMPVRTGLNDCGALCLYLICKAQGISHGVEELRKLVNTTEEGNSLLDLKFGAAKLGFEVSTVNLSFEELHQHLRTRGRYAIVHLAERKHFSPAVAVIGERIVFADPGYGVQQLSSSDLVNRWAWKGDALLMSARERTE